MKLTTKCNKCGQEVKTKTWSSDRVELARSKGEYLELTCKNCNTTGKYHVDSLSASPSRFTQIVAFLIFILGTPTLIYFIWEPLWTLTWSYAILAIAGLLLIPVTVYGLILKDDQRRVSSFNRHKLKGLGYG
jgi:hypothetical protein